VEEIQIEIVNWDKHNPRKDIKHPNWFALSNRFLEDPDFFDFTAIEIKAVLYVWCQASQKNSSTLVIRPAHAKRVCDIDPRSLDSCLTRLENLGHVRRCTESVRSRTPSVHDKQTDTTNRTLQTEQTEECTERLPSADRYVACIPELLDPVLSEFFTRSKIKASTQSLWLKTYEDPLWLKQEILKAIAWLDANPAKRPKANYARFLGSWFSRGWEYHRKSISSNKPKEEDFVEYYKRTQGGSA